MHIPWKLLRKEWNKKLSMKNSCTYYEYEIKTLSSSQAPGDNAEISGPCWSRRVLPPRGVWKSNRGNPTHPWDENSVWPNVRSGSSPVDIDQTLAKLQLRASLDKNIGILALLDWEEVSFKSAPQFLKMSSRKDCPESFGFYHINICKRYPRIKYKYTQRGKLHICAYVLWKNFDFIFSSFFFRMWALWRKKLGAGTQTAL